MDDERAQVCNRGNGAPHNIFSAVAMGDVETIRGLIARRPLG
jgi:hypothetical protein